MDKLVFVKELKSGTTKNGKPYPIVCDQDNELWNIWNPINLEVNKAYLFTFHVNDKNFKDIDNVTPLVNIFQQKALKEVANKNDIKRDLSVALSYAKDLLIAHEVPDKTAMFSIAYEIYDWMNTTAESLMPKEIPVDKGLQ